MYSECLSTFHILQHLKRSRHNHREHLLSNNQFTSISAVSFPQPEH
nr:MAG TPA: hypothetical protein [Caudoviricetes sp.]